MSVQQLEASADRPLESHQERQGSHWERETFRPCLAEFLGTFALVFLSCSAAVSDGTITQGAIEQPRVMALALANGFTVVCIVSALVKISGAQINPAVTLSLVLLGKERRRRGAYFVLSQLIGAIAGCAAMLMAYPLDPQGTDRAAVRPAQYGGHILPPNVTIEQALVMEFTLTFVLVLVVLRVGVDRDNFGPLMPLIVGLTVTVLILVGQNVSCASMNPARSFGPAVVGDIWYDHWIYWIGPFTGSLLATAVYHFVFRTDTRS
eukprot:m.91784 g.91784  ORF g.91784 m.91784 type:complete len:264 (+) comp13750_c0_seq5:50-841(+)